MQPSRGNIQFVREILRSIDSLKLRISQTLLTNREIAKQRRDKQRMHNYNLTKQPLLNEFNPTIPPPSTSAYLALNYDINLDSQYFDHENEPDFDHSEGGIPAPRKRRRKESSDYSICQPEQIRDMLPGPSHMTSSPGISRSRVGTSGVPSNL